MISEETLCPAARTGPGSAVEGPSTAPVVLVVDDDPVVRVLAGTALGQVGYDVREAGDGADALRTFEAVHPDLVLLDVNMPALDGFEVCARLRETPRGVHTPILMMTTPEDTETIHRAYEVGATDFVTKPVNWTLLGYRMRYALRDTTRHLLEATRYIGATLELPEVLRRTTREVVRAVGADTGGAWLLAPDKTRFLPMAAYRAPRDRQLFVETSSLERTELAAWIETLAGPTFVADSQNDARLTDPLFHLIPHQSLLIVPLREAGLSVGVIAVAWIRDRHRATMDELRLVEALARYAEDAITNARLHSEVQVRDEQLRQSQKMEAVGRLAGGIAHDFNNVLSVILGHSQLLLATSALSDSQRRRVEATVDATKHAAALTRQLLTFSRKQVVQPRVVDLNDVILDVSRMLKRLLGEDVELVVQNEPVLGLVNADPGQLAQVLMNLAINARDAMPRGGRLTLETANVDVSEAAARNLTDATQGAHVLLRVRDTGVGMDEYTLARLFEPFFTTKDSDKGTGLGLATVHGIVRAAGGFIRVNSAPGQGSTFEIYLPRVAGGAAAREARGAGEAPGRGTETLLLVEDAAELRVVIQELLHACGYEVLVARDGIEGLKLFRASTTPISLLLTDVVMPRMNGVELAGHVRAERPETKVLYVSGHTDNAIVRQAMSEPRVAFLTKPFSQHTLAARVREVLDGPTPDADPGRPRERAVGTDPGECP